MSNFSRTDFNPVNFPSGNILPDKRQIVYHMPNWFRSIQNEFHNSSYLFRCGKILRMTSQQKLIIRIQSLTGQPVCFHETSRMRNIAVSKLTALLRRIRCAFSAKSRGK